VPTRLIHLSDLHFGAHEDASTEVAVRSFVEQVGPELVVATGDLTHRGRPDQHERAARFLRGLGPPVLAVPGNHDIPYTFPGRLTHPWREFERLWETTEPVFRSAGLAVVGLNSVLPWRHQSGGLADDAIARAAGRLADTPAGALRVVCLHHHLTGAPWRSRKRPVARRGRVIEALAGTGAELILSGHIHQAAVNERREFEVGLPAARSVALAIAPGLGRPRPHRSGEARGLNLIEADERELRIETLVYGEDGFASVAAHTLPRRA
jgi:3',5'-cyclic AMP phosphodiesterase CpdA